MMSARAGRSRFFIGIVAIILMIGFVAIFHSSQQQLDESRQSRFRCEQQQEALNSRLQAIIEHKFRIEKALESERREHLETKQHFEQKMKEQKDIHNKAIMESNVRMESLQQHYKLLQSEHSDLVEDCKKTKQQHLEQINSLERKVKSLQSQNQQIKNQRDKDVEQWKAKYETLELEKKRLDSLLKSSSPSSPTVLASDVELLLHKCTKKNENFERILKDFKKHCDYQSEALQQQPLNDQPSEINNQVTRKSFQRPALIEKNFNQQLSIGDNLYKINIKMKNSTTIGVISNNLVNNNNAYSNNEHAVTNQQSMHSRNVGDATGGGDDGLHGNRNSHIGAILNSVENFQIVPNLLLNPENSNDKMAVSEGTISSNNGGGRNGGDDNNRQVLQQPFPLNAPLKTSSTTATPFKIPDNKSVTIGKLVANAINVANQPSSDKTKKLSSTQANDRNKESNGHFKSKPIPLGVAPVPENFESLLNMKNNYDNNQNDDANGIGNSNNNNGGDNNEDNNNNNRYANVVDELSGKKDDTEQENGAHEVGDDKNDDTKDHLRDFLDNVNNAAEEEDNALLIGRPKKDDDVDIIGDQHRNQHHNDANKHNENVLEAGNDKLINEVVGDQGKEPAFPDSMHNEEAAEEEEEDDDYNNPAARQQGGQAIRN